MLKYLGPKSSSQYSIWQKAPYAGSFHPKLIASIDLGQEPFEFLWLLFNNVVWIDIEARVVTSFRRVMLCVIVDVSIIHILKLRVSSKPECNLLYPVWSLTIFTCEFNAWWADWILGALLLAIMFIIYPWFFIYFWRKSSSGSDDSSSSSMSMRYSGWSVSEGMPTFGGPLDFE